MECAQVSERLLINILDIVISELIKLSFKKIQSTAKRLAI